MEPYIKMAEAGLDITRTNGPQRRTQTKTLTEFKKTLLKYFKNVSYEVF